MQQPRIRTSKPDTLRTLIKQRNLLLLLLPGVVTVFVFHYLPMYGVIIAFKNYNPIHGIGGSPWVGWKNFEDLFQATFFWRAFRNTLILNGYQILFAFPIPILFALLLNELRNAPFKKWMQTITYFPHFLSWVVIGGFVVALLSPNTGVVETIAKLLGYSNYNEFLLVDPGAFRAVLVISEVWKNMGWGSIIYLAAITGVNPEYYDAASLDGANRFKQALHVTLPSIMPTVVVLLVLRIGNMMGTDLEQILVLYSPNVYEVGDVLSTYVFRLGLYQSKYSFTTAVGLFQAAIGFVLIVLANRFSRRSGGALW